MSSNKLSIPLDRKNNIFETSYVIKSFALQINPLAKTKIRPQQSTLEKQDLQLPGILQVIKVKQLEPINRREISQHKISSQKNFEKGVNKILYRASDGKKRKLLSRGKIIMKIKPVQSKGLAVFYRNQVISLISLLNRKVDYFNCLKNKRSDLQIPLRSNEIQELLQKELILKGKDKGRLKFNNITNQQLKSIGYKTKPISNLIKKQPKTKEQKQQQQASQYAEDTNQQNIDIATWKRRNGCGATQKVFIVKGGYMDLRQGLLDKGWFQNQDVYSCHFDMKWTTKISDIDYGKLRNGQSVNHFNNNHHLTSKYGITRRLKTLILQHNIDIDKFYPRCFDLGDQTDLQNFIESFKYSFAQSVAKRFLLDKQRYNGLELKIRTTLEILKRRAKSFSAQINQINNGIFPVISPEEWAIITEQIQPEQREQKLQRLNRTQQNLNPEDPQYQNKLFPILDIQIKKYLEIIHEVDPQMNINGMNNVWIVKPNFLSRGRGIKCFNNIYDICDYCLGRDLQFVVQKYIERPLLVNGKKFDIRQWVFIQDFNPPKIWFYDQCYLRFCGDDYNLQNIHNKFGHLTNNSIQKHNKKAVIKESMWTKNEFQKYIGLQNWVRVQQKIKNIVVWSIKSCQGYVTGKRGSFELVGYDFMIDEDLNPWLIEINMSPSMDYSTPVTSKLVRSVLTDTASIISSKKQQQNIGKFACIYKGSQDAKKYNLYEI